MATIFIIDDSHDTQKDYKRALGDHRLVQAYRGADARALFQEHIAEIDLIVLDGYLAPGDPEVTTLKLAEEIRRSGFSGPMIAASSDANLCYQLTYWCDFKIPGDSKRAVPDLAHRVLCGGEIQPSERW